MLWWVKAHCQYYDRLCYAAIAIIVFVPGPACMFYSKDDVQSVYR